MNGALLLVMSCLILVGVVLPLIAAVNAAREAARRAMCVNNLKQIALAMHNYASANGCLPAAFMPDKDGKPMHSWHSRHSSPTWSKRPCTTPTISPCRGTPRRT